MTQSRTTRPLSTGSDRARRIRPSIARWIGAICLGLHLFGVGVASARAQVITEFSTGWPGISSITGGPDGNIWFAETFGRIGKITPSGVITEYNGVAQDPALFLRGGNPGIKAISSGPDGNLWFTDTGSSQIGKITPAGEVTEYSGIRPSAVSIRPGLQGITTGPDGNLWFAETEVGRIGKITPAGEITEYRGIIKFTGGSPGISSITAGPDGNLWFTETDANRIGKITPSGSITEYTASRISSYAGPYRITAGPDGNLWFTEKNGKRIGKITPSGVVTEFSHGISSLVFAGAIAAGPDGNIWFAEDDGRIGRLTIRK